MTQIAGGSSNLTFKVADGKHEWVLRRPPLRHVLATAHDMGREHRVQSALEATDVPVAAQVAACDDESVIGAPFYMMEYLDGVVYDDVDATSALTEDQGRAASYELVDVLARLHAVDYEAVGLGGFGRPAGYLARPGGALADAVGEVEDGRDARRRRGRATPRTTAPRREPPRDRPR